jgi:hypothetical protein
MRKTTLATFKELNATGKYDLQLSGSTVIINYKGKKSPSMYIPLDILGQEVLVTEYEAIHPNLLMYVPELDTQPPTEEVE